MSRDALIAGFVAAGPWSGARIAPLAGDASNRRYFRLSHPTRGPAVVMDAPPEKGEDTAPFLQVTAILRGLSLSAPEVLDTDPDHGLLLLEDLGDALYARVLEADRAQEDALYAAAIDLLAELHAAPGAANGLPPYDAATYLRESRLVTDWYLPAAGPVAPAVAAEFDALIRQATGALDPRPTVCVLRDYHAENLIWLPRRAGVARVGLLDYQDALAGHPAYDVVSLLEDARRDTAPELRAAMVARYLRASGADPDAFLHAHAVLGAQRNLKILGIFARLWRRDGKPAYLDLLPRVWGHLTTDLSHPALADLAAWVRTHLPPPDPEFRARLRAAR